MEIIGYKESTLPSGQRTPTSIGVYSKETGEELKTCTLEMRVYRPGYILQGIELSANAGRRALRKLLNLSLLLEKEFGKSPIEYLKPIKNVDNKLKQLDTSLGLLPKLGDRHKKWEVESLLEHTVVDEKFRVTTDGRKLVKACKIAPDPYIEFERLCLLKGIADRLKGLSNVAKIVSSGTSEVWDMTDRSNPRSYQVEMVKPMFNDYYLVDVEDAPTLYSFPSPNSPVFISNMLIGEHFRFHYSLRKEIYKTHLQARDQSSTSSKLHRFAGRIRTINLLKNLNIYRVEQRYRFIGLPTNLLKTLAMYTLSRKGDISVENFLSHLKKEFFIVVSPDDLKSIYPFSMFSNCPEAFFKSNFDMFIKRLVHAGIVEVKPDGEVALVERS